MTESLELRRRRLMFRAVRRGTKESDMVIGGFARRHLQDLDPEQLDRFEALLECNDPDILGWVIGLQTPPPEHDNDVLSRLRAFKTILSDT